MDVKFSRYATTNSPLASLRVTFETEIEIATFCEIISGDIPRHGNMNDVFKQRLLNAFDTK